MKPVQKRIIWSIALYVGVFFLPNLIAHYLDTWNRPLFYTFPPFATGADQEAFFMGIMFLLPLLMIPLGVLLSSLFISLYLRLYKHSKKIQFIGFARIQPGAAATRKRYLNQMIFGVLLCINVWVLLFQTGAFSFWVLPGREMIDPDTGRMFTFPMEPWWWLPISVTVLVISVAYCILDSGLVYVKRIVEHPQFSDTERVGSQLWNLIKGYAGISVVVSFISLLFAEYGQDAANFTFPVYMALALFFYMAILEWLADWGRRFLFKTVQQQKVPEIIDLSYTTTPITTFDQLLPR
jgi:hypothetical protein